MNQRFIKFIIALALCFLGLYMLVASLLASEAIAFLQFAPLPHGVNIILYALGLVTGVLLARQAIIEELSVTSD